MGELCCVSCLSIRGYNNVLGAVSLRDKIIDMEIAIKVGFFVLY